MATRYINADLDLLTATDLTPLVDALQCHGMILLRVDRLHTAQWIAVMETGSEHRDAESTIIAILDAIDALTEEERDLWRACENRTIDVGYDCGRQELAFKDRLSSNTLARMAKAGVSLVTTLYPENYGKARV